MKRILLAILGCGVIAGCVVGQSLPAGYEPPAATAEPSATAATAAVSVRVSVTDDRPLVKSGDKPPFYVGTYRAAIGTPWDVTTDNKESLASLVARDLAADLTASGFHTTASTAAARSIAVSIRDWNFTGYQNGKFWYDLLVAVHDPAGTTLATSVVQEEVQIKGTLMLGARGGFEREMPGLYARIIRKIARENAPISDALASGAR